MPLRQLVVFPQWRVIPTKRVLLGQSLVNVPNINQLRQNGFLLQITFDFGWSVACL